MSIDNLVSVIKESPVFHSSVWLLICAAIFSVLQELFPFDKNQPRFRKDLYIDAFYWVIAPLFYGIASTAILMGGFYLIFGGNLDAASEYMTSGGAWTQDIPLFILAILSLIFTDFILYWTHRIFHGDILWKYHSIHHGAQNLDWAHCVRFHPLNIIFHTIIANSIALWVGFTPASLALLVPFNILYSAMVHANLNWTFGPFKYVFASPVFHRWHHTHPDEGGNKNFAATFPILDIIFGTFYMPKDKIPTDIGKHEDYVPKTLIGQIQFPFMRKS